MFDTVQRDFAAALLDTEKPLPGALISHTTRVPEKRFAVYRNNVVAGLVNALAKRFPATERIVGEEFFRAMARVFARENPPTSPLLMTYGDDFSDFVAGFEPAAGLPYLADVARLEAVRTRAYHAADAAPVEPERLRRLDSPQLDGLRIVRHPSAAIVRSAYPLVTVWGMNAGELELGPIDDWRGEDALVVRPGHAVFVHALPAGGAAFLETLFAGGTLADAARSAQADSGEFDLAANLAGLISSGAAAEICILSLKE